MLELIIGLTYIFSGVGLVVSLITLIFTTLAQESEVAVTALICVFFCSILIFLIWGTKEVTCNRLISREYVPICNSYFESNPFDNKKY